ncbi:divalent-cation tolerance protein CutA [Candidatus Uhrbacteria bacterium]|nr:divalent-cation tolerance protein CutA [Candidatus Uhrbacteria bacterium]
MKFCIIYITYPDMKTAKRIVSSLMKNRLIACAHFFPIQSTYWWNGDIKNSKEIVSILKTKKKNWEKISAKVTTLHPYEAPCIICIDAGANNAYKSWIRHEVR